VSSAILGRRHTEASPEQPGALLEIRQSARSSRCLDAHAIVRDGHDEDVTGEDDANSCRGRPGVTGDIRECLSHHGEDMRDDVLGDADVDRALEAHR
jgi:hypothetical protein